MNFADSWKAFVVQLTPVTGGGIVVTAALLVVVVVVVVVVGSCFH